MADFDLDDSDEATLASFAAKSAAMRSITPRRTPTPVTPPPDAPTRTSLPLTRQGLVWAIALGGALDRPRCRR